MVKHTWQRRRHQIINASPPEGGHRDISRNRPCLSSGRGNVWKNRALGMKFCRTRLLNLIVLFRRCSRDVGTLLSPATHLIATTVRRRNSSSLSASGRVLVTSSLARSGLFRASSRTVFIFFPVRLVAATAARSVLSRAHLRSRRQGEDDRERARALANPVEKPVCAYSVVLFPTPYNIVPVLYAAARHGSCTTATTTQRLCNIIIVIVRSS